MDNYHCIALCIKHIRHLSLFLLQILNQEKLRQVSFRDQYIENQPLKKPECEPIYDSILQVLKIDLILGTHTVM